MKGPDYNPWADLVVAVLSTGGYRLEKTFGLLPALEESGLTDPHTIAALDEREIARRLVVAGYNRGPVLTALYTERLASLGAPVGDEERARALASGTKPEIAAALSGVKGVGPVVIENFLALRG